MKSIAFAVLVMCTVGCGDDEPPLIDPHELGDCDKSWGGEATECERACKVEPVQLEAGCPARLREDIPNGFTNCTNGTFTIMGGADGTETFRGCCLTKYEGYEGKALFAQCTE